MCYQCMASEAQVSEYISVNLLAYFPQALLVSKRSSHYLIAHTFLLTLTKTRLDLIKVQSLIPLLRASLMYNHIRIHICRQYKDRSSKGERKGLNGETVMKRCLNVIPLVPFVLFLLFPLSHSLVPLLKSIFTFALLHSLIRHLGVFNASLYVFIKLQYTRRYNQPEVKTGQNQMVGKYTL